MLAAGHAANPYKGSAFPPLGRPGPRRTPTGCGTSIPRPAYSGLVSPGQCHQCYYSAPECKTVRTPCVAVSLQRGPPLTPFLFPSRGNSIYTAAAGMGRALLPFPTDGMPIRVISARAVSRATGRCRGMIVLETVAGDLGMQVAMFGSGSGRLKKKKEVPVFADPSRHHRRRHRPQGRPWLGCSFTHGCELGD